MSDYIIPKPYTSSNSFHEIRFPEGISYGAEGGPEYSTDIMTTSSASEQRNQNWEFGRCKYNVAHGVKNEKDITKLITFRRCRKGRAYGFRYKDWSDYKAVNQIIGTVDVVPCQMQLLKKYISGEESETRIIRKPVEGTVILYAAGNYINTGITINHKSGAITITNTSLIGKLITADFEFDVPVRFDADYIPTSIEDFNNYSMSEISLIEVKI
ncbi:DUF2460 domain-containing protein [Pelosinus sp. UFO1]|uniref:DUF2460 domain-containing protein n=1 Tax=Pelosinus sp. UFO1 TaxID=484770 RepID=UPI0004D12BE3|nr:DUF2460 domain-containing protein [Pelosinus sp. UFO1]AIF52000.1 Conserved hypothetical protein CHP02217 [Pelosinus sp. UFO1]